jgi:hypothetical protein
MHMRSKTILNRRRPDVQPVFQRLERRPSTADVTVILTNLVDTGILPTPPIWIAGRMPWSAQPGFFCFLIRSGF